MPIAIADLSQKPKDEQIATFQKLFVSSIKHGDIDQISSLTVALLDDTKFSVLVSKPLFDMIPGLVKEHSPEKHTQDIYSAIYQHLTHYSAQFPDAAWLIGDALAFLQQIDGNLEDSAKTLELIPFNSFQHNNDKPKVFSMYLRICRLYLDEDNPVKAESFLNRANRLKEVASSSEKLALTLCFARVQDFNGQYLVAARKYYDLSLLLSNPEDRLDCLNHSISCAILGKAGSIRSRILSLLIKDDRATESDVYPVLRDIVYLRILSADLVDMFDDTLYAHQREMLPSGYTVLQTAVMEHNILAASQIYTSIHLSQLCNILSISKPDTMKLVAKMIMGNRLEASIDQVSEIITFSSELQDSIAVAGAGDLKKAANILEEEESLEDLSGKIILNWDTAIAAVLHKIDSVAMSLT